MFDSFSSRDPLFEPGSLPTAGDPFAAPGDPWSSPAAVTATGGDPFAASNGLFAMGLGSGDAVFNPSGRPSTSVGAIGGNQPKPGSTDMSRLRQIWQ